MQLQSGQNIPLHTATLTLRLDYPPSPGFHSTPETCLFMLNAEGKVSKRAARTVLTGMCYSVGSATRQGSSSPTRFIGQSAMTSRT